MEDIHLPRHVIDPLEHRWASRLQQDAQRWKCDRSRPAHASRVQDGARRPSRSSSNALAQTPGLAAPNDARRTRNGGGDFAGADLPDLSGRTGRLNWAA